MNQKEVITHQGRIVEVVQTNVVLQNGKKKVFEHARRSPGVRCIIMNKSEEVLLTKEFRHELNYRKGGFDLRLPGGKFFDSLEEWKESTKISSFDFEKASESAGTREMKEETGYDITNNTEVLYLGVLHSGTTVEWDLHYHLFKNANAGERVLEDGEEHITNKFYSKTKILELVKTGQIKEGRSVAMLMRILL